MTLFDSYPPDAPSTSSSSARAHTDRGSSSAIGGRYRVLEELGRGGMGVVYRVLDVGTHEALALKQLLVPAGDSQQVVSLFEREYYVLAQLAHPRVIAVYDYGVDTAGPFYTMELLDGGDLKALAPLPVERACSLIGEVCSSIALLHARRLVHRDITPRNIRCTRDGHAKLIDFGAMVPMGPCTHSVGTPAFIAPEVVNHSELDARTDLFSLGATLYFTLTGEPPFSARRLCDLREAWSAEVLPPSHLAPGIPPALDALCLSLLRIDPARRPRTAFEVMQRLQAIAGIEIDEPQGVEQAYLTTPELIGSDETLRRVRTCMRRTLHGEGSALMFESAPGIGRSRALDACVIEAKTLGATVLRAAANTSAHKPFAVAEELIDQLLQSLPELAQAAADAAGVADVLLSLTTDTPRLRPLSDPALERAAVQDAIGRWLARVCESQALMIAVDDVQRADEASVALLAALAIQAKDHRLLIATTVDAGALDHVPHAFGVLAQHSRSHKLEALTREQTQALLVSVFGNVPHMSLLAERLFQIGLGNPGDTLAVARHLVSGARIRYENGQWTLPSALDASDLPASAGEALAARVGALPALARRLVEAQALVGHAFRRRDYALLAPEVDASALDAALSILLEQEIVQSDGEHYSIGYRALSDALCALLSPAHKRERHLALFELYRGQPDTHPYLIVHHLFEADQHERALDLLAQYESLGEEKDTEAALRAGPTRLAHTLQRGLDLALTLGRPPRQVHELRRRLCGLALVSQQVAYEQIMPVWLAQLEHDSGLAEYRKLDAATDPGLRLQQALNTAVTRFAATPERERVYRVDEAIKYLAGCVVSIIMTGWRALDIAASRGVSELLEPFTPLSPALSALFQNARAFQEDYAGRVLTARARWAELSERLDLTSADTVRYLMAVRYGAMRATTRQEAITGRFEALEWAQKLDGYEPLRADAMSLRRLLCLLQGDTEGAERFGKQAELLSLRAAAPSPFLPDWCDELRAYALMHDLAGVRRVIEAITPLAARYPGWRVQLRIAEGSYALIRGEFASARAAFVESEESIRPHHPTDIVWIEQWISAVTGRMTAQLELGEAAAAAAIGEVAIAICAARGVELGWLRIANALAIADAKQGQIERAIARSDEVIDAYRQHGVRGLLLAHSYATRARIAIWARDSGAALRYSGLAAEEPGGDKILATMANHEPSMARASGAGAQRALAASGLAEAPAAQSAEAEEFRSILLSCADPETRASLVLEQLCELTESESGQLYLVKERQGLTLAAASAGAEPDALAEQFAEQFFVRQIDEDGSDATLTYATQMLTQPGAAAYVDHHGRESRLYMLTCKDRGVLVYVGLAVLRARHKPAFDMQLPAHLTALASCLLHTEDSVGVYSKS